VVEVQVITLPDKRGRLYGSTQHQIEVYLQGAQQPKVVRAH